MGKLNVNDKLDITTSPVLYTVGLLATFLKMNFSVCRVLASQGSKEKNVYFLATFQGFFLTFHGQKIETFLKILLRSH